MNKHFRDANTRDIETQPETLIHSNSLVNLGALKPHGPSLQNITKQQETNCFDTVEQRK